MRLWKLARTNQCLTGSCDFIETLTILHILARRVVPRNIIASHVSFGQI